MTLQAIIADDEPLARKRIRETLAAQPRIRIAAECGNGLEAVRAVEEHHPDLLFLDVEMPELDGFGVLERISPKRRPAVIFVTAFDQYAVHAFEADAVDYVLKPFEHARLERAVQRAVEHRRRERLAHLDEHLLRLLDGRRSYPARLVVKSGTSVYFVKAEDIDWVEAARNYVKLHAGKTCHLMRETMTNIEAKLDPETFVRIHRSTLVNVNRLKRICPGFGSESVVELEDGTRLMISRAYRRGRVKELLGDS